MNETSAIPIISAAAVAAVRPGFLRAFSPPVRAATRSGTTPGNSAGHSGCQRVSALRSHITSDDREQERIEQPAADEGADAAVRPSPGPKAP